MHCKTRWSERDISYERFYLAMPLTAESLEIINGTHPEFHTFEKHYTNGWDVHSKREATNHLNALTKFEFIISIISLYRLLHPIAGLTKKLQGRSIDVIEAYANASSCVDDMKFMRENIEFQFSKIQFSKTFNNAHAIES